VLQTHKALWYQPLEGDKEKNLVNFIKSLKELMGMTEKLSTWKFLLLWLVFAMFGTGYLISALVSALK
jgi:hypothetical protein